MRSAPLLVAVTATAAVLALGGCGGPESDGDQAAPSVEASPSGTPAPTPGQGGSEGAEETSGDPDDTDDTGDTDDTYASVDDQATLPLDASLLDGVDAISAWEGSELTESPGLSGAELVSADGEQLLLIVTTTTGVLAKGSAEAEMRDWTRNNPTTQGPVERLDPVVVDGEEMLRARGEALFGLVADQFIHATGDTTVEIQVQTPAGLDDEERERRIGQVLSTVRLS